MRPTITPLIPALLLAAAALAQTPPAPPAPGRIVIPARNSNRPRQVNINLLNGGVTVKAYSGKEVIVESQASTRSARGQRRSPAEVDGMRRIELPSNSDLDIEEEDNVINIRTRFGSSHLEISVPVETSVKIRCTNGGDIVVEGVHGEVDASNLNGRIILSGISGTVIAHSLNGGIKASMDRVDPAKPISFSTMNGEVDITLPKEFRANLKMKSDNGDIYSDFDIRLDTSRNRPVTESTSSGNGKYHMKADRTLYGSVNGGGQEASFTTFNGRISLRKK